MVFSLKKAKPTVEGSIHLSGSKSISNRVLIIRALCEETFDIQRLASAKDTETLQALLSSSARVLDAGAAGTTYRFMTAYLATQPGEQVLTGSERMKQRPIGILVEALRQLGAQINYLEQEGYPPLLIGESNHLGHHNKVSISAGTSSQYISALLMIAPTLPHGMELQLVGKLVSRPYIEMTLALMQHFGVSHEWEGDTIQIAPQSYRARPFVVEADWSAASYYYAIVALADQAHLELKGLFADSLQGDAVLVEMMQAFGVKTSFNEKGVLLEKTPHSLPDLFAWDFIRCPDLAQTIAVVCAGLGVPARFTGLETLSIKETDRIAALKNELGKVHVRLENAGIMANGKEYFAIAGKSHFDSVPVFDTYEDHRMAMAFAPLALQHPIQIAEPMVVVKSYPEFYEDLKSIGFELS
ncbi:MAG TPA: 3-phosphoshikimate 1-carboxyvinyltransferase [Saprospiraceae bacterium]|nr:3-phosphoshikimate 1-carboxyvinyltransferase [Saprospiraceae bacterium]HMQ81485.1 3-phosphoshikimate 1-carboxyvinyltransferase [Saprospiraceae bacterium]